MVPSKDGKLDLKKIVKIAYEEFTKEWKYGPIEEIEKKYGVPAGEA